MEYYLREYPLSEEMKFKLRERISEVTNVQILFDYDFRALVLKDHTGKEFTSIIFNSKHSDPKLLSDIYNIIFNNDNETFLRTRNYLRMRKHFRLEKEETIITIASFLQSSGITNQLELLNKLLIIIEAGDEY